jgi:hypothetical protein
MGLKGLARVMSLSTPCLTALIGGHIRFLAFVSRFNRAIAFI